MTTTRGARVRVCGGRVRPRRWGAAMTMLTVAGALRMLPAQALPAHGAGFTVALDRPDWRYHVGDTARFTVARESGGDPASRLSLRIEIGPERGAPRRRETVVLGTEPLTFAVVGEAPGFVRLTASAGSGDAAGGRRVRLATAAFDPGRLVSPTTAPSDLLAFWRRAIDEARQVPLAPVLTRLARWSTPEVDVYHVSFQNQRVGSRLYGMLSVPTGAGPFPAMLVVPGAGVRPYFPDVATARRGVIHLAIGIHGIPVDRDSLLYNELRATALQSYYACGVEDRDSYYYKRVYVGVVRAGDFLAALPQFDGTRYAVQGESQGGGLAIVAAALDPRVTAIAVSYPALADQFGYLIGRPGGWPHLLADTAHLAARAEKIATLRYYDVVNFARLVRVPGIYAWGFNDSVVPPTASYATVNAVTAPRDTAIVPSAAHARTAAQRQRMDEWLLAQLGVAR